ncbi:ABC transporter permease subunit [Herbidospora sp. NBRC 101105]|uniref:ABC transporter permease n=1 Tax=Herbidospora sp. NBRC 101105 TaxID=3032195 RepID=UPI0025522E10|nr:ABC transporter permease subunit [Herbidospora sp. NBRC 101105]
MTVVLALVYGYIPFFIVPLFSTLDRIDPLLLKAARDLGCSSLSAFWHVTLPLSRPGLLTASAITALPMFGDYYTNTLVSGSPTSTMIANKIEFYLLGGTPQGTRGVTRAAAVGAEHGGDGVLPDLQPASRGRVA